MGKRWFQPKPYRNWKGIVPKAVVGGRKITIPLVPRVQNLVQGGVIAKPVWLDAVLALPPPTEHKFGGPKPVRFEWREEDRLRRVWQRRNPAAAMHPKVLFLDESKLPPGTATEHPADAFVRRQLALMRKGLSEEEAYRRVLARTQQQQRADAEQVAAAREQARALGADGAGDGGGVGGGRGEGFAARLLRRFAEEAREGNQPYPKHWFFDADDAGDGKGGWRGLGETSAHLDARTSKALGRTARAHGADEAADLSDIGKIFDELDLAERMREAGEAAEAAEKGGGGGGGSGGASGDAEAGGEDAPK